MKPYYDRGGIQIFLGDCREVLPTLGPVDHVITDPPYSEHVHSKSRAGSRKLDATGFLANYSRAVDFGFASLETEVRAAVGKEIGRLATRWALVFSDVESASEWRTDMMAGGLDYVRTGAWIKVNATPQFTGDRPGVGFEAITICHPSGRKRWNGGGKHALWSHPVVQNRVDDHGIRCHPTQKPTALMAALASQFTDPGELILDPFGGSMTTAVAAKKLGRRCISIELEERWCEIGARRLEQEVMPLFPPTPAPTDDQGIFAL